MKSITFAEWAASRYACTPALEYLDGKLATWAVWIQSCGDWRRWVCEALGVEPCEDDLNTGRPEFPSCQCEECRRERSDRAKLNRPRRYAAIKRHWQAIVLPALRAEGVK